MLKRIFFHSLLMTIFDMEITFPGGGPSTVPQLKQFLASVKPRLAALYDENGDIGIYYCYSFFLTSCTHRQLFGT